MQRPCAYCKLAGHHIRDCEERKTTEERKRNSTFKPQPIIASVERDWHTVRTGPTTTPKYVVPSLRKVETVKNLYANLYSSSDDELEEGEIVEEDRHTRVTPFSIKDTQSMAHSSHASASLEGGVLNENWCKIATAPEPVVAHVPCWNRSGVKGVVINTPAGLSSSDDDSGPECDYVVLAEGMAKLADYVAKFKGMSWADIECDSDLE